MLKKNEPNYQRRLVIQGAVVSASALAIPGVASATCGSNEHAIKQVENKLVSKNSFASDDVSIELVESQLPLNGRALARVTITNKSDRPIKLSHLSPGTVATQKGIYQINATLQNKPIALRPNGVFQFWLEQDDGTQAMLSRKPLLPGDGFSESTMLEVSVVTETESGKWVGTQRVQAFV